MSSVGGSSLISSFPISKPFIPFSFLTGVARTSSTMLTYSRSKTGYPPGLVPDLREKAFSLSPSSRMEGQVFLEMLRIRLRKLPSPPG